MTRQEKIQEQVEMAKSAKKGWKTVICSMKNSASAKKDTLGFHFRPEHEAAIGNIFHNEDGSVSTVEAVV